MSCVIPIPDHVQQALNRLVEQYREKANIEDLLRALNEGWQPMEDTNEDLCDLRGIDMAFGYQLDRLGAMFDVPRDGLNDDDYRLLIKAKILVTIAEGDPETMILVYKFLVGGSLVVYQDLPPAGVGMAVNADITPGKETDIYRFVQSVAPAGVRVDFLACFDPDESFAFEGPGGAPSLGALGFGDSTNPSEGGMFGKIHLNNIPFAFAGGNPDDLGMSTVEDPLVGGAFQGL